MSLNDHDKAKLERIALERRRREERAADVADVASASEESGNELFNTVEAFLAGFIIYPSVHEHTAPCLSVARTGIRQDAGA
jgi:hypothetical protein